MSARPWGRGAALRLGIVLLSLLAAPLPPAPAARDIAAPAAVGAGDIEAALTRMEALGAFYRAFAERETNAYASERWYRLGINYEGTAAILRRALAQEGLVLEDLPDGRRAALGEGGRLVIDADLDGRWLAATDAAAADALLNDALIPVLIEALAQRRLPQDWPWLADHLRALGGFVDASQDPLARPLLARYFQAKDAYLWLALQRIGEGNPSARQDLARRQRGAFESVRAMESEMAVTLGGSEAQRLQRDWTDYVGQVDAFAVTRGWVLLDPALRQTQLGAEARAATDAVDQAAAEVVAAAPRSALAAARSEADGRAAPQAAAKAQPESQGAPSGVNLEALVAQAPAAGVPQAAPAAPAAPAEDSAKAESQVMALQEQVDALQETLAQRAEESARLEAALAAERERLGLAERERAVEPEPLETTAPPAPLLAWDLRGWDRRTPYAVAAVAAVLLLTLLVWLRRRRPAAAAAPELPAPLLLSAPDAVAAPLAPPVVEAPQPAPPVAARVVLADLPQGARIRVTGVTPPTAAAKAAMQAAAARHDAAEAAGSDDARPDAARPDAARPEGGATAACGTAALGSEAATAAHPIVRALRQGNLPLFELLFGELTDLRSPQLQRIVYGGRGEDLAIVCRAVGVDKLLFGAIFLLTDHLRGGSREEEPERTAAMLQMYDRMPPATAQKVLAKWQRNWSGQRRGNAADVH